mgnify:CR=1 FL=1
MLDLNRKLIHCVQCEINQSSSIVEIIDRVLMNFNDEVIIAKVADEVNEMMGERAMFVF